MSKLRNKKIIGITMGDPAGIGPEVIARSLAQLRLPRGMAIVVLGHQKVFRKFWPKSPPLPPFMHLASDNNCPKTGHPDDRSGRDSLLYLDTAVDMLRNGSLSALVTGPVSKESVGKFIPGFKGHTTYLADAFGLKNVEMVFVSRGFKMVLVTRHIPLKDVPGRITREKVKSVISMTHHFLHTKFGMARPRIAVCGLNPHAGEGGQIGKEEVSEIIPAIQDLQRKGWNVDGPLPADTLFEPHNRKGYDLIVTMYHDQGLTVMKSEYFNELVNLTIGLPFIRTSPAHGTAFGIAGKGVADHGSMLASIKLAMELA